jgi:glycosyltransferase involved in cell wall biosynthesis
MRNAISQTTSSTAKAAQAAPIKICMLALRQASSDVRAMRTSAGLAQAGFALEIVDIEHDRARPREESLTGIRSKYITLPTEEHLKAVRVKHIFMPGRLMRYYSPTRFAPWLLFKGWRMARALLELLSIPADIYHASDITALPACYIAALLRGKPLIFEPYELPLVQPWITRSRPLHALSVLLLRSLLPRCSGIIVTSPSYAPELQRRYGGRAAVVIRNIPTYQPPVSSNRIRQYLGLGPKVRIAIYQGALNPDRGLDVLVRAARFLDPDIVIVMKAWGDSQPILDALIAREQVGDRVKIIPPVPYEESHMWTASADIGLVIYRPQSLSVRMTLPNKVFEYLMAGVPVLASSLDAVADLVSTYDVGRIQYSLSPPDVGRAISAMLGDEAGLSRMRRNALAAVHSQLRWEVESQKLVQLYHDVSDRYRVRLDET